MQNRHGGRLRDTLLVVGVIGACLALLFPLCGFVLVGKVIVVDDERLGSEVEKNKDSRYGMLAKIRRGNEGRKPNTHTHLGRLGILVEHAPRALALDMLRHHHALDGQVQRRGDELEQILWLCMD